MPKKILFILSVIILIFSVTACSAIQLPWTSASTSTPQTVSLSNFASQPVKNKLAAGLLELEGSGQAITAAQAKELLPLWKAVKSLSSDSNTTTGEIAALYVQIQGVLTGSQIQAIQDLDLSTSELTVLVQKYASQTALVTSDSTSTTSQTAQSAQPQGEPGGDMLGGGMQDPSLAGITGGAQAAGQVSKSGSSTTSASTTTSQTDLNLLLADPIISLLEARIASLGA
jgi:hypothetical protein